MLERIIMKLTENPLAWQALVLLLTFLVSKYDKSNRILSIIRKLAKAVDEKMDSK